MGSISENLRKYLEETPEDKIKSDWESTKHWDEVGTTCDEFMSTVLRNKLELLNESGKFKELAEKAYMKYNSEEYISKWASKGLDIKYGILPFLFEYAKKYGVKKDKMLCTFSYFGDETYLIDDFYLSKMKGGEIYKIDKFKFFNANQIQPKHYNVMEDFDTLMKPHVDSLGFKYTLYTDIDFGDTYYVVFDEDFKPSVKICQDIYKFCLVKNISIITKDYDLNLIPIKRVLDTKQEFKDKMDAIYALNPNKPFKIVVSSKQSMYYLIVNEKDVNYFFDLVPMEIISFLQTNIYDIEWVDMIHYWDYDVN